MLKKFMIHLRKNMVVKTQGPKSMVLVDGFKFQREHGQPIMPQIHEYETLVSKVIAEGMKMCEYLQAYVLPEKPPLSQKDYHD